MSDRLTERVRRALQLGKSAPAPRDHYLYVNMRDVGCNCGERCPDDRKLDREAWFKEHIGSLRVVS